MTTAQDEAMLKLHEMLAARKARGVRRLPDAERREYNRLAKARSRTADRVAGPATVTDLIMRDALADAAQAILATGADGSETIEKLLHRIFEAKPAVVVSIMSAARCGRLRPRLLKLS